MTATAGSVTLGAAVTDTGAITDLDIVAGSTASLQAITLSEGTANVDVNTGGAATFNGDVSTTGSIQLDGANSIVLAEGDGQTMIFTAGVDFTVTE